LDRRHPLLPVKMICRRAGSEKWLSVKDPSVVRYKGKWHLFCTVRGTVRSHAVIYVTFADWNQAAKAEQRVLTCHPGYFCAPQVFYFTPHARWYLICQAADDSWQPRYQPAFSTTDDITSPDSWSRLTPLFEKKPANVKRWLDFWVICDDTKAHLFFTSLDGRMWRSDTPLQRFPGGWSQPEVVLRADVFEAGHTYRLKRHDKYLTLIEAQNGHGWRYYKAYLADRLDGRWTPLAALDAERRPATQTLDGRHQSRRVAAGRIRRETPGRCRQSAIPLPGCPRSPANGKDLRPDPMAIRYTQARRQSTRCHRYGQCRPSVIPAGCLRLPFMGVRYSLARWGKMGYKRGFLNRDRGHRSIFGT